MPAGPVRPIQGLQTDERGRPYIIGGDGQRVYIPQSATRPKDGLISEYDFDTRTGEWKRKTNWNNVLGLGTLGVIGAGAGLAAMPGAAAAGTGTAGAGGAESAFAGVTAKGAAGVGAGAGVKRVLNNVVDPVVNAATNKGGGWSYPLTTLLSSLFGGGMQLWGANQQIGAADRAAQIQADAAQRALDFAKEQDARNYQDYLKERERAWGTSDRDYQDFLDERTRTRAREDAERTRTWGLEDARTARLEPFRARGAYAYNKLADLLK